MLIARIFRLAVIAMTAWHSGFQFDVQSSADDDPRRPPAVACENVPVVPAELADRLRQYQNTRSAGFRGWSPDGNGILISTRFGNTSQLHRVYSPGGRREQITFFDEPCGGRFVPDNPEGMLLLSMGIGGNERYQVYAMTPGDGGHPTLLTDGKSRNLLGPVRKDGLFAIVSSNARNGKDTDLYIIDPNTPGQREMLFQTDGEYWIAEDWSRDGSTVLMRQYVSINECYPALLNVATKKKTIIPVPGDAKKTAFGSMSFSNDGRFAYVTSDAVSEFKQLAKIDLKSMEYTWLTQDIPWDVGSVVVAPPSGILPDEGLAAFTVNDDGSSGLYLLFGDKYRKLEIPMGIVSSLGFSPDGTQLGFTLGRPDRPSDVFSISLLDAKLTQWTFSETGGLPVNKFVQPNVIRFESFDQRKIPAFYYKPRSANADNPAPVVINIHGGPESQARPTFDPQTQFYLAELGFAVVRPNVRGSRGYGKNYLLLDNGVKREDSVRDIGALLDWIKEQPELDEKRIAVYGGSYGGYMVLASLTHYSDRLKAGVDIVGIASFKTFLENTSAYRRDLRRAEYGDERTDEMKSFFKKIDPINNAEKIKTSLLVAHGTNDPRVPFSEAEQIAPKVRANDQTVWTVYANNEGHGFARKENRDYISQVITMFLMENLK